MNNNLECREIVSRAEARRLGLASYFTGRPCIRGHIAERATVRKACRQCEPEKDRKRRAAQPGKFKERQRAKHERNREKDNLRSRKYRLANLEKVKAQEREAYQQDKERAREANKKYREKNRDALLLSQKEYYRKNRDLYRAALHRRRARMKACEGSHSAADIGEIIKLQNGKCAYCRTRLPADYHLDHIKPIARGGTNDRRNLQALCAPCNKSKSAKDPLHFARQIGMLL